MLKFVMSRQTWEKTHAATNTFAPVVRRCAETSLRRYETGHREVLPGVREHSGRRAGSAVAERAGRNLKKSVMELGGSDPFIVLEDAPLESTIESAASIATDDVANFARRANHFRVLIRLQESPALFAKIFRFRRRANQF